tara:strand:- start:441 stop:1613 length:1173 start_codon:yes stop_codon:yes gene_type:complete
MPQYIPINTSTDVITDTTKITTGYFTGGIGSLAAGNLVTSSLSSTQQNYYYNMQYSSEDQLSVAFGHYEGSGSGALNETKAIYKQFQNLLLSPDDIAGTSSAGFKFGGTFPTSGSAAHTHGGGLNAAGAAGMVVDNVSDYEDFMYFIVAERSRMKDRLNKKNWTLKLSGSITSSNEIGDYIEQSSSILVLTDDSNTVAATATPVGPRYNIVSGSDGTIIAASSSKYYGHFYPNVGVLALRGRMVSSSLPGTFGAQDSASFQDFTVTSLGTGLAPELNNDGTADNAIKLANAMAITTQAFRSEEDQTSKAFFCRALANDFNFSNNPTFTSGSDRRLRHSDMIGYPHTFISTVGLYQTATGGSVELVAVGRLSSPVQKNYGTEATIKVKLTY